MPEICGAFDVALGLLTVRNVMPTLRATAFKLIVIPGSKSRAEPFTSQLSVLGVPATLQLYECSAAPAVRVSVVQNAAPQAPEARQATNAESQRAPETGSLGLHGSAERCPCELTVQRQGAGNSDPATTSQVHGPAKAWLPGRRPPV